MHALRGVFYPSNFVHPLTSRFLLQRPELDITDVPLLYTMLYSSGETWKKDRAWIIRYLSDGMISSEDWRILKRRHTWDILASLFQSSKDDLPVRKGILEVGGFFSFCSATKQIQVLVNLTNNSRATASLVMKSGLLSWIETQVIDTTIVEESSIWVRVLENILVVGEVQKFETATEGEWKSTICRILLVILSSKAGALLNTL